MDRQKDSKRSPVIRFEFEGRRIGALPGKYKGKRRRGRVEKVAAECGFCTWRSRVLKAELAEQAWMRHMEQCHPEGR